MAEMYDNPTKETWRGWAWNQIAARINPGSLVVTLCGKTSLDAQYGFKRGMNVVGVDISQEGVDAYRDDGFVATCDKLHRQVWALKPDAVIFDMLGGITTPSMRDPIRLSLFTKASVWNGLRGRDNGVPNQVKRLLVPDYTNGRRSQAEVGIHRGRVAWAHWAGVCLDAAKKPLSQRYIDMLGEWSRPAFQSYRSKDSGQYFDSVAWTTESLRVDPSNVVMTNSKRCNASKRKAAAAKALITMRKNRN